MDKDAVILKYEQDKVDKINDELSSLSDDAGTQADCINDMQSKLDEMYKKLGKSKPVLQISSNDTNVIRESIETPSSYEALFETAAESLVDEGIELDQVALESLVSSEEMNRLLQELNEPLPREYHWNKNDFLVVFVAGVIGVMVDIAVGNRDSSLVNSKSKLSKKLDSIHTKVFPHKKGSPIDFQGKIDQDGNSFSFGGGNHRVLSPGHDLLKFVETIKNIKNGTFKATVYKDGVKYVVSSAVNQNGKPYEQMSLISAIFQYTHHMIADFFSTKSLPFPGYSFLKDCGDRGYRKLAVDMYENGFNCKNIMIQSVTAGIIELFIRLYYSIQSVKQYKEDLDINEDFSNWEMIKNFIKPANQDKLQEMLLVSHTIVLGINAGKIVITKRIQDINVSEIASVAKYGIKVTKAAANRHNEFAKLLYHSREVNKAWAEIASSENEYDDLLISEMTETITI